MNNTEHIQAYLDLAPERTRTAMDSDVHPRDLERLISRIQKSILGRHAVTSTPFGNRRLYSVDSTSCSRQLTFIEAFMLAAVSPIHGSVSEQQQALSGRATGGLMEEVKETVLCAVGGESKRHAVSFYAGGNEVAINSIIQWTSLRESTDKTFPDPDQRPVVLLCPFTPDYHQSLFEMTGAEVVRMLANSETGTLEAVDIQYFAQKFSRRSVKLALISAACALTGVAVDVPPAASMLRSHGFEVFCDYTLAAPHVAMDMSNITGLFFRGDHFVGGPQASSVFVTKKSFAEGMSLVSQHPNDAALSLAAIRLGLVLRLKDMVGGDTIHSRGRRALNRALRSWSHHPFIELGGSQFLAYYGPTRLPFLTFNVIDPTVDSNSDGQPSKRYLHHNYVAAVLSDIFGIQVGAGSFDSSSQQSILYPIPWINVGDASEPPSGVLQPGAVRLTFNFYTDDDSLDYVISAIEQVALHAWALLPLYAVDPATGLYRYKGPPLSTKPRRFLAPPSLSDFFPTVQPSGPPASRCPSQNLCLKKANDLFTHAAEFVLSAEENGRLRDFVNSTGDGVSNTDLVQEEMWFPLGSDVLKVHRREKKSQHTHPAAVGATGGAVKRSVWRRILFSLSRKQAGRGSSMSVRGGDHGVANADRSCSSLAEEFPKMANVDIPASSTRTEVAAVVVESNKKEKSVAEKGATVGVSGGYENVFVPSTSVETIYGQTYRPKAKPLQSKSTHSGVNVVNLSLPLASVALEVDS